MKVITMNFFKKLQAILFLFLVLSFASLEAFRVMTSNVLGERAYEKHCTQSNLKLDLNIRINKLIFTLKKISPDLVGFQEFDTYEQGALMRAFSKEYAFIVATELPAYHQMHSHLAFMYKKSVIKADGQSHIDSDAKILSQKFIDVKKGNRFIAMVIHAPWGQGGDEPSYENTYAKYLSFVGFNPVIVMGDWNTDGNPLKNHNKEIFNRLFNGFVDHTSNLPFTARGVNDSDQEQKIDYIVSVGFRVTGNTQIEPQSFNHLLVHGSVWNTRFNVADTRNHYSDHAAVFVDLEVNNADARKSPAVLFPKSAGRLPAPRRVTFAEPEVQQPHPLKVARESRNSNFEALDILAKAIQNKSKNNIVTRDVKMMMDILLDLGKSKSLKEAKLASFIRKLHTEKKQLDFLARLTVAISLKTTNR